jgi:hypothetical protein
VSPQDLQPATERGSRRARQFVRWVIDIALQEAKGQLGAGQARNRVGRAVERTVTCGFHCLSLGVRDFAPLLHPLDITTVVWSND